MPEPNPADPASRELTGRIGKYEIVRVLGKGAMGQVYIAHDTFLDRDVALKVMIAQIADDPELKQRFEREARAVARMTHPNVVTVFELGNHSDGSPFIAMELLKGQDLQKLLRQPEALPLPRRVAIIVQVLAGLAHAHQAGIVHRDIKPANIFIQEDGSVKIMDFGVARLTTASMTGTGAIVGTADYMSPEQVKAAKVDGRSDLFSTGCMLYEVVVGRRPFHADNLMAIFYKITHEEADFDAVPAGPEYDALLPIIRKALAKDLAERYQTAYEFGVELREWLKVWGQGSQGVLEHLVDIEAPSHFPLPMTDAPGVTRPPEAGTDPSRRTGARRGTTPPTRAGRTTVGSNEPTVISGGDVPTAFVTAAPGVAARAARRPERAVPVLWLGAAALLAIGAVAVAVVLWTTRQPAHGPEALVPTAPPATAAPLATTLASAPPVTAAPAPTFAPSEGQGRGAAALRAAQAAFRSGDYDRAAASAQEALGQDPQSPAAKAVLEQAIAGQSAAARLQAGQRALAAGDLAGAEREAAAALQHAPWERRAVELRGRIEAARQQAQHDADARAQQARSGQINGLLNDAASAMQKSQFDAAIAAYEKALALDPGNVPAQTGRQAAIGAKSLAAAAASAGARTPAAAEHAFVSGRTEAKAAGNSSGLAGFSDSPDVVVKKATQAADLPGRVLFEVTPPSPASGERFRIAVTFVNEGTQPIPLQRMTVATTVDGRRQAGSVPTAATMVAPGQRAVVWQSPGDLVWRDGTRSWSMEVVLFSKSGDSYTSTLTWK